MASVAPTASAGPIMVDGVPLKQRLAKAERNKRLTALAMVAPLLLFIIFSFVVPIGDMLFRSVDNPRFSLLMPDALQDLRVSSTFLENASPPSSNLRSFKINTLSYFLNFLTPDLVVLNQPD